MTQIHTSFGNLKPIFIDTGNKKKKKVFFLYFFAFLFSALIFFPSLALVSCKSSKPGPNSNQDVSVLTNYNVTVIVLVLPR